MAKHVYNTATFGSGMALTIQNNKHVFLGKSVPVFAEVDDESGAVQLFVRQEDLLRLKQIEPLDAKKIE